MNIHLLQVLRNYLVGTPHELIAQRLAAEASNARQSVAERALLSAVASDSRKNRHQIVVGHVHDGTPVEVPVEDLVGVSRWTTGATGSGKSAQVLAEELQLIVPGCPWALVHLDAKSESAPWLTDTFLPLILGQWDEDDAVEFFSAYYVLNPFDGSNLPPLNVLCPPSGVPHALVAKEISQLISESLGRGHGNFGIRMTTVLNHALRFALSVGGLSLLEVRQLLVDKDYLNGLVRFCTDQESRDYFLYRFPRENKESIYAVVSRLDLLLMLDDTKRVLCAPESLDIADALTGSLTILDLGSPPRGAEHIGSWWLGLFVRSLARAIMGRPMHEYTRPTFCVMDEWWTAIDAELAFHFERLLTLARFKKVGLWLLNQLPGQIGSRHPQLLATLKNSCGLQVAFRQSHEDARTMAHMLPTNEDMFLPRQFDGPKWDVRRATPTEQKQMHIDEMARLQDRVFWFWYKKRGLDAVQLHAPYVPFDEARRAVDCLPNFVRDLCQARDGGYSRADLDAVLARRREHIARVRDGRAENGSPDFLRQSSVESAARPSERTVADARSAPKGPTMRPQGESIRGSARTQRASARKTDVPPLGGDSPRRRSGPSPVNAASGPKPPRNNRRQEKKPEASTLTSTDPFAIPPLLVDRPVHTEKTTVSDASQRDPLVPTRHEDSSGEGVDDDFFLG